MKFLKALAGTLKWSFLAIAALFSLFLVFVFFMTRELGKGPKHYVWLKRVDLTSGLDAPAGFEPLQEQNQRNHNPLVRDSSNQAANLADIIDIVSF